MQLISSPDVATPPAEVSTRTRDAAVITCFCLCIKSFWFPRTRERCSSERWLAVFCRFGFHARARDAAPKGGSPFSVGLLFKAFARFVLRAAGDFCFLLIIIIGCVLDDATYKIKKGTIYVICRLLGSDVKTNGVGRNGIAPSCFTDTHVFVFKKLSSGGFF